MPLIWRSSTEGSAVEAALENYAELTQSGWYADTCTHSPKPFPKSTLNITGRAKPTDFFFAGPLFIVSQQLRDVLGQFDTKAEFLPLQALVNGDYAQQVFWLVNILDWAECLDMESSEYKMTDHGAKGIKHLVIKDEIAAGHDLFLIGQIPTRNQNPRAVRDIIRCVSENLATAVIEGGFSGVTFVSPEHHKTYPPGKLRGVHSP